MKLKETKDKPVSYVPKSNVWSGQPWPYETVPMRITTISSPSNGGKTPRGKPPGIGCDG